MWKLFALAGLLGCAAGAPADPRIEQAKKEGEVVWYTAMNLPDTEGIVRPGPDHIGFEVESLEAIKARLFERCCPLGSLRMADVDGVLLDIAEHRGA